MPNKETNRIKGNISIASFELLSKRNLKLINIIKNFNNSNFDLQGEFILEIDGLQKINQKLLQDFNDLKEDYLEELSNLQEEYLEDMENSRLVNISLLFLSLISLLGNLTSLAKGNKNHG